MVFHSRFARVVFGCLAAFALATTLTGCGYPEAQVPNMELISSLRTACSARNDEWLAANETKVEQRRKDGQMNDEEYAAFQGIIAQARSGDWAGAERACLNFQKAQRPTAEQVEKMRKFHEGE